MTSFAVQTFTPSVVSALASKEKGSAGNRMDCAGAQVKNTAVTGLQAGVATAGTVGALALVNKQASLADSVSESVNLVMNKLKNTTKSKPKFTYNPNVIDKATESAKTPNNKNYVKGVKIGVPPKNTYLQKAVTKMKLNLNQLAEKVLTMSPKGKAGLAVAAVALPVIAYIAGKGLYQAGQIDQKYTDKAKFQNVV